MSLSAEDKQLFDKLCGRDGVKQKQREHTNQNPSGQCGQANDRIDEFSGSGGEEEYGKLL